MKNEFVETGHKCLFCEQIIILYTEHQQAVCGCDYMDMWEYEEIKAERRDIAERDKYGLPHRETCKCEKCVEDRYNEEHYDSQDPEFPWG